MNSYQYTLEPYQGMRSRYSCPQCEKPKVFTRYIDSQTGNHLPAQYGKCNRENNCGYHLNPYQDQYRANPCREREKQRIRTNGNGIPIKRKPVKLAYIPSEIMQRSLAGYERNTFVQYLIGLLGESSTLDLIKRFKIGTSNHWQGATVFWLIDNQSRIVGGQVILFDESGCTKKETQVDGSKKRYNGWVHVALRLGYKKAGRPIPDWLQTYIAHNPKYPCLFGLPQLDIEPSTKPIAIVESAKTAIIASAYLPQYIWLAVGGKSYLNAERLKAIKGRKVVLFPDNGAYEDWSRKAKGLAQLAKFTVSDLLEGKDIEEGSDIADYLVQFDIEEFQKAT